MTHYELRAHRDGGIRAYHPACKPLLLQKQNCHPKLQAIKGGRTVIGHGDYPNAAMYVLVHRLVLTIFARGEQI